MGCRSGCRTRDHRTYGECLRSARILLGPQDTNSKAVMNELSSYIDARKQGVQPASTRLAHTQVAMEVSQRTGTAFDAGSTS